MQLYKTRNRAEVENEKGIHLLSMFNNIFNPHEVI